MKWSYLIFLVFASWMYQRIIFYPPVINYRAPASGPVDSCVDLISKYYPQQSKDFLKTRCDANKDLHSFYRSFAPLFYDILKNDQDLTKPFAGLEKYVAVIVGDVHAENFGFVLNSLGRGKFLINDADEVARGPLYLDMLRHLVSAKILNREIEWKKYNEAYQSGLLNKERETSDFVKKGLQNSPRDMQNMLEEYITTTPPIKFKKYKTPMLEINNNQKADNLKSLKLIFPKITIFEQYAYLKADGGSAGLVRYKILAQLNPNEEIVWLDVKEMTESSYDKINTSTPLSYQERMYLIKNVLYEGEISNQISIVAISGKEFSVRLVNQFGLGIRIKDVSNLELNDVLYDEAFALGQLHARALKKSAFDSAFYSKEIDHLDSDEVKKSVKKIIDELEKKFSLKI